MPHFGSRDKQRKINHLLSLFITAEVYDPSAQPLIFLTVVLETGAALCL